MTQTTTIKAGESAKTIQIPEGQSLTISGSAGALGVAYLLDASLGGMNALKSWTIGTGALSTAIGPFANTQKVHITCQVGQISATTQDAVLTVNGGSVAATISGTGIVGQPLTATLPAGVVGTLQFVRFTKAATPVKTAIAGAVANAVNSLAYTPVTGDAAYNIGCDASNVVSPSATVSISTATSSDVAPSIVTEAAITGTPQQGVSLSITGATASGSPTPTFARVIKMDGTTVASGDQTTGYSPVLGDVGKIPSVSDTASNGVGSPVTSTATGSAVIAAASGVTAPLFTAPPTLPNLPTVGTALTAVAGTYTGTATTDTLTIMKLTNDGWQDVGQG